MTQNVRGGPPAGKRGRPSFKNLGRAIRFLGHYRGVTILAYLALFLSTGAQLMVPQMVQNVLDSITDGMMVQQTAGLPPDAQAAAMATIGMTAEQYQQTLANPYAALYWSIALILVFAVMRGLFAFAQSYMSEKAGQSVAFDFRNDLFAKIQRLSFSYHDRNRTGQLMVRATDDVEKVRIFIGQGLLMAVQAVVLLVGALILLLLTNFQLTLIILPILPLAMVMFMVFGMITQPLFMQGAGQALDAQHDPAGEPGRHQGGQGLRHASREQQKRFDRSAEDLMSQQITVQRIFTLPVPGHLPDRQPGPGRRALFWRPADHQRHADHRRVAEVQPLPGLCLLPARPARLHHHADEPGRAPAPTVSTRSWTRRTK